MSAFTLEQRVRFSHVDPAGIAYSARIHDYIHEAFEELWEDHVGVRYDQLLLEERVGFPLVSSRVDYLRPLRFGDRPRVRVTCFQLGRSSFGLRYVYTVGEEVCLDARMTSVCVDTGPMRPRPLSEPWRERLAQIQEPL